MEYRVLCYSNEEELEHEINILAKEGFEVSFFTGNNHGTIRVLMQRNRLE